MRYRDIPLDFHSSVISGRLGRAEDGHRCSRMARRTHANCSDGSQETLKNVTFEQHCVVVFGGIRLYLLVFNCI